MTDTKLSGPWVLAALLGACLTPAAGLAAAEAGPRCERVIVIRRDKSWVELPAQDPVPVSIRARPSAEEIARVTGVHGAAVAPDALAGLTGGNAGVLGAPVTTFEAPAPAEPEKRTVANIPTAAEAAARTIAAMEKVAPAAAPSAVPSSAPVAATTPAVATAASARLTEKDHESLRWLVRCRAKFPGRYQAELERNPRARWLIQQVSTMPATEQRAILEKAAEEDEDEEVAEASSRDDAPEAERPRDAHARQISLYDEQVRASGGQNEDEE